MKRYPGCKKASIFFSARIAHDVDLDIQAKGTGSCVGRGTRSAAPPLGTPTRVQRGGCVAVD